jgi:hypothetical protein
MKVQGRAREWALGLSSKNTEQIAVLFDYVDVHGEPQTITWFGYFSEAACDRTLEALRYCGWEGDDFGQLDGLDRNEVELELEHETYEGKERLKVRWVNRLSSLALKAPMDAGQIASFAARMRGKAIASKQKMAAATPRTQQPARAPASATRPAGGFDPGPSAPYSDEDSPD